MKQLRTCIAILALGAVCAGAKEQPLYKRLGGVMAIAAVVSDFVEVLLKDPAVISNKQVAEVAQSGKISVPGVKFTLTQFICAVTGGPQLYSSRTMKEAHKMLGITEAEWTAAGNDLKLTLEQHNIPEKEQGEIFRKIASLKKDIVTGTPPAGAPSTEIKPSSTAGSLYNRLGGVHPIAAVLDDFINRVLKDEVVTGNPKVAEAAGKVTVPGLKYLLIEFVCQATGGPQKYSGKPMKEAHKGMGITEAEWEAAGKLMRATFEASKIPAREQRELLDIVAKAKKDIVGG